MNASEKKAYLFILWDLFKLISSGHVCNFCSWRKDLSCAAWLQFKLFRLIFFLLKWQFLPFCQIIIIIRKKAYLVTAFCQRLHIYYIYIGYLPVYHIWNIKCHCNNYIVFHMDSFGIDSVAFILSMYTAIAIYCLAVFQIYFYQQSKQDFVVKKKLITSNWSRTSVSQF